MTRRLYNEDSYVQSFRANVISCVPHKENMYQVVLDRTAFFPEGGGQTSDTGMIGSVNVVDVRDKNEEIIHITDGELQMGCEVEASINWEQRFDKMQQHTGEHIVSGIMSKEHGLNNVGFHLNSEIVTMDFDNVLTREQINELEIKANEAVYANIPIVVSYPSKEELEHISYRSKIEIEGQVRIVQVGKYDICACCAPHVGMTGEIGLIKFTDVQNHRGGIRITMKCGKRGLLDYQEKMTSVRNIGSLLSAKENAVIESVERLKEEVQRLKSYSWELQDQLICYKAKEVREKHGQEKLIFDTTLDVEHRRELVNCLVPDMQVVGVLTGDDETGYQYILGSTVLDLRKIGKELNNRCNGRGGGKPTMVQGSIQATEEEIQDAFYEIIREHSVKSKEKS